MSEEGGGASAWGIKPGMAWAEEVEAEEAKHGPLASEEAFPSLGDSVKQPAKSSKKKAAKMSLTEFNSTTVGSRNKALSDKELLLNLPKGSSGAPREERGAGGLGGGFKDYGGNRGEGGGFRGRREDREEREPSRADAANDWGAERKFVPSDSRSGGSFGGGSFRDRGSGGFGESRDRGGFGDRPPREERPVSEADQVDDWGANRKFQPSADSDRRSGGFGGGFRDREGAPGGFREREGGFRERPGPSRYEEPSRADTGDWGTRRAPPPAPEGDAARPGPSGRRGYGFSEQPVSQADTEDRWSHRAAAAAAESGSGSAAPAPAERPRLKLAPRTKPLPDQQQPTANGVESSPRVAEAEGSSEQQQAAEKPRRSNPFGDARPRELVLKEKGIDYHKEELKLEHGEVMRDPTPEEQEMEAEVESLRQQLEELQQSRPDETDTINDVKKELDEKERTLYTLQAKLDDEVRYSKHRPERERDSAPRGSSSSAAAEDMSGFEVVRNPRKERSAAPAADGSGEAAAAGGSSKEQEGNGASSSTGAWGRGGGGSLRDRERGGGRGGGPGRERRPNESMAGRTGGGW